MTLKNYSIRNAKPEDATILAEAEREIAKIPGRLVSRPEELKDENFREKIISLSKNTSGAYLVVEDSGLIVGHAIVEPHKLQVTSHVVFLTIAIHEGHQSKGIGKMLMQYLIEWAKAHRLIRCTWSYRWKLFKTF